MKRIVWTLFIPFFLGITLVSGQSPAGVDCVVTWFSTVQDDIMHPVGQWVDQSMYNLDLDIAAGDGTDGGNYHGDLLSMNYNPSLHFGPEYEVDDVPFIITDFNVQVPRKLRYHTTIIAVLVPRNREADNEMEWALINRKSSILPEKLLDINKVISQHSPTAGYILDYGESQGTDLLIDGYDSPYEIEKYGKIVTYDALLEPNFCNNPEQIIQKILQIYSDDPSVVIPDLYQQTGEVPEFIVFNHFLSEEDRFKVETYLALKYGISKELDYTAPNTDVVWDAVNMQVYSYRITGIGSGSTLCQSKSTTFYDEDDAGRFNPFESVQDFSHHRKRLLAIGVEDESTKICDSWIEGGYLIWGDDDTDLKLTPMPSLIQYESIDRKWGIQYDGNGGNSTTGVSWCNFIDMDNTPNANGDARWQKKFDYVSRPGVAATSQAMESGGSLSWRIRYRTWTNPVIMGFSTDNHVFTDNAQSAIAYRGYNYACKLVNLQIWYMLDTDGDGAFDEEGYTGQNYNTGNAGKIRLEAVLFNDHYEFKMFRGSSTTPIHQASVNTPVEPKPLYGKMNFQSNAMILSDVVGTGFNASEPGGTSVELSIDRMSGILPDPVEEQNVVLLIDETGTGDFQLPTTRVYPGMVGRTPDGNCDKFEFCGVVWDTDGSGTDVFTFALDKCAEPEVVIEQFPNCCGEVTTIAFHLELCETTEIINYILKNKNGQVATGTMTASDEIVIAHLDIGAYTLCFTFQNGTVIEHPFDVINDNVLPTDILPDTVELHCANAILAPNPFSTNGAQTILYQWTGPDFSSNQEVISVAWPGIYTLTVTFICDGITCTFTDQVLVESSGDLELDLAFDYDCCGYGAIVSFTVGGCDQLPDPPLLFDLYDQNGLLLDDILIDFFGINIIEDLPNGDYILVIHDGVFPIIVETFTIDNTNVLPSGFLPPGPLTLDPLNGTIIPTNVPPGLYTVMYSWTGPDPTVDGSMDPEVNVFVPGEYCVTVTFACEDDTEPSCDLDINSVGFENGFNQTFDGMNEGDVLNWLFSAGSGSVVADQIQIFIGGVEVLNTGAVTLWTECGATQPPAGVNCDPILYIGDIQPVTGSVPLDIPVGSGFANIDGYTGNCGQAQISQTISGDQLVVAQGNILITSDLAGQDIQIIITANPCQTGNNEWALQVNCTPSMNNRFCEPITECITVVYEEPICDLIITSRCSKDGCREEIIIQPTSPTEECIEKSVTLWIGEKKYETYVGGAVVISDLPPGDYTVTAVFEGCECPDIVMDFEINYCCFPHDLFEGEIYCIDPKQPREIIALPFCDKISELCLEFGLQYEWRYKGELISNVCEAPFRGEGTYTICVWLNRNEECKVCDTFIVQYCFEGLTVIPSDCPESDRERFELSIVDDDYGPHEYEIWTWNGQKAVQRIYRGRLDEEVRSLLIPDLPNGSYQLRLRNSKGYLWTTIYDLDYDSILPFEIIKEDIIYIRSEIEKAALDASKHISIEAEYIWTHKGEVISHEARIDVGPGIYSVAVLADDCEQEDIVTVQSEEVGTRSLIKPVSKMKITHANPVAEGQPFNLWVEHEASQPTVISVFDINGRLMDHQQRHEAKRHDFSLELFVGLYIVRVSSPDEERFVKIVVQ